MTAFSEMNLSPELIESLKRQGFINATEVQALAIPEVLRGKNVTARAKTGTGKTAAFIVPIMQMLSKQRETEALVIVPTRELALQVAGFAQKIGSMLRVYTTVVYGGASINVQMQELRSRPSIVIGTPGRIIDLMERGALNLQKVRFLVLDEADIMLDMGFIDDVEHIISRTPESRQMMMFSATLPPEIAGLQKYSKGESVRITVGKEEDITVSTIKQYFTIVPHRLKFSALLAYIKEFVPKKAIIFARTKYEANAIHRVLISQRENAILLHGGLTQSMRERSLGHFRGGARFMIATNVAARGLDIADVTDIINFGAPDDPNVYVHRVGRSARMGKEGRAVTIIDPDQRKMLMDIQDYANVRMDKIELNLEPFRNLQLPIREPGGFREGGGRNFHRGGGGYGGGGRSLSFNSSGERQHGGHGGGGGGGGHYGGRRDFHRGRRRDFRR